MADDYTRREELRALALEAGVPTAKMYLDLDNDFSKAGKYLRKITKHKPVWFNSVSAPIPFREGTDEFKAWLRQQNLWWAIVKSLAHTGKSPAFIDSLAAIQYASRDWSGFLRKYGNSILFLGGLDRYEARLTNDDLRTFTDIIEHWRSTCGGLWIQSSGEFVDFLKRTQARSADDGVVEVLRRGVTKFTAARYV